ncbi:MAG: DinB family protein [Mycobacterium leprae]
MWDIASPDLPAALAVPFGLVENAFRRLSRHVQGMSQSELEFTGEGVNSTAMLLAHLAFVDMEYLHCIKGVSVPADLEAEYGPVETESGTLPVVTGLSAAQLLERYRRVIDMIRAYLQSQTDADAVRPVQIPWWPEPATVRYVLWHMAAHSMHHQGQIVRLKAEVR